MSSGGMMSEERRQLLRRSTVSFTQYLDYSILLPHLISAGIFSNDDHEAIMAQSTPTQRRYQLIQRVQSRGNVAYEHLYQALRSTRQDALADLLEPERHIIHKSTDEQVNVHPPSDPISKSNGSQLHPRYVVKPSNGSPLHPRCVIQPSNGSPLHPRSPHPDSRLLLLGKPGFQGQEFHPGLSNTKVNLTPYPVEYPPDNRLLAKPILEDPTQKAMEENAEYYREYETIRVLEPAGVLYDLHVDMVDIAFVQKMNKNNKIKSEQEHYNNFSRPKGLALIINNRRFHQMTERLGTDVDEVNMTRLLQELGYTVKQKNDVTAAEMNKSLRKFAQLTEHSHCDSAVVVVLTHGEHGQLYGVDGVEVSVDRFVSALNCVNCPGLAGKPKLFFIQACRGQKYDDGHRFVGRGRDNSDSKGIDDKEDMSVSSLFSCLKLDRADATEINELRDRIPSEADFLIAYATTPGYVSWRNSMKGSWFIQSICEVFAKHARDMDLLRMLTKVNNRVSDVYQSTNGGYKQIPDHSSRLRKLFYFFPGFYNESNGVDV